MRFEKWGSCQKDIEMKYVESDTWFYNQKDFAKAITCIENAYETRSDSNMKMFVDLCIDAFDENREKTWQGIFTTLNKDPYWVAKTPKKDPPPEAEAKADAKAPAKKKKVVKKVKKEKTLEERLWWASK
jgi:hypothetical protein